MTRSASLLAAVAALAAAAAALPATPAAAATSAVVLSSGQKLAPGAGLSTPSGQYRLQMTTTGALEETSGTTVLWTSGATQPGASAIMLADGNLVIENAAGTKLWWTATWGHTGAALTLSSTGAVALSLGGRTIWSDGVTGAELVPGQVLAPGQALVSPDGDFELVMQADGNLVDYLAPPGGAAVPLWATGTRTPGSSAELSPGGVLEVLSSTGALLWQSPHAGSLAAVEDGGDVVVGTPAAVAWTNAAETLRDAAVAVAASQVGVQVSPAGTDCNPYTTAWGAGTACSNGERQEAWCADFSDWVWAHAGVPVTYGWSAGQLNGEASSYVGYGKARGTWHPVGSGYRPQPGDVAVYGLDAAGTWASHVGVVVTSGGAGLTTVNGNWGGQVGAAPASQSGVSGYTSPVWAPGTARPAAQPPAAPTPTPIASQP